ncbi:uncharacterized protein LOC114746054 [Neltuma alba]|uniref:uncharacterized protein LOC114746054 n=1 Tax=Neltuma alba TaxID=207710 RepID=UPI0010A4C29A|nr:uncharacterized protein LOC114746054 [Prosopis alba]
MNLMIWNSRGAGGPSFRRLLQDLKLRYKLTCLALMEPRQAGDRAELIAQKLGWSNMYVVEARGFSGGIWLFWEDKIHFSVLSAGEQFVHGLVKDGSNEDWFLTLVYGHPNAILRRGLWESLSSIQRSMNGKWVVGGDFNAVPHRDDRSGLRTGMNGRVERQFQDWITASSLLDIGFSGPHFTWGRGSSQSRIDRILVNDLWTECFPDASVIHLPKFKSDHCPLLLRTKKVASVSPNERPFRFFAPWVLHEEFGNFVKDNWAMKGDWNSDVHDFKAALSRWNVQVFGHVQRTKGKLYRRLEGLSRKSALSGLPENLERIQKELWYELEKILSKEELMWQQYSRAQWFLQGDRNSRYFHIRATSRRKRNRIEALRLESGIWSYDLKEIMDMGCHFFKALYTENGEGSPSLEFGMKYPTIDAVHINTLGKEVEDTEVKRALFDMGPLKSPGPDGLNPLF